MRFFFVVLFFTNKNYIELQDNNKKWNNFVLLISMNFHHQILILFIFKRIYFHQFFLLRKKTIHNDVHMWILIIIVNINLEMKNEKKSKWQPVCVCVATWNTRFFFYFVPKSLMFLHPSCQKLNEKKEEEEKNSNELAHNLCNQIKLNWKENKWAKNQCWLLLSTILKTKQKKSNPSPCF